MKTHLIFIFVTLFRFTNFSQVYAPVSTFGYNLDAVAETTTALLTTGGAIDGSNYVLYSVAYGALYNVTTGLPNNGLITSGTQTYQLQSYTTMNMLYVTAGLNDSLTLSTPAPYAGLSVLGFATEGTGALNITVRFTDNTTQVYNSQSFPDWFGTGNSVISGFDRAGRNSGTPGNASGNPKMFNIELPITCANRAKNVNTIRILNTGTNARICVMAVSGAAAPSFSANSLPVTCSGGTNGSASITASGGITPYTYTWSTTPVQMSAQANNLPVGLYTYSVQDNGGCVFVSNVSVSQSLVTQPPLNVGSSAFTICSGSTFTLGTSGANTYTWVNGGNAAIFSPVPPTAGSFTTVNYFVSAHTAFNCLVTGSIQIAVNPLPGATFVSALPALCKNSPLLTLSNFVAEQGGNFSGTGVVNNNFSPTVGPGTFNILYTNTNTNNCTSTATAAIQVFTLAPPQITPPAPSCITNPAFQMTANPIGGIFLGPGITIAGVLTPFVAGVGTHGYTYSITVGPCTSSATANFVVNPNPTTTIAPGKTFFCVNSPVFGFNGQPSGGSFAGPGIVGTLFDPSKGILGNNNVIVYTYIDGNGCSDTASVRLTVSNCIGISETAGGSGDLFLYPNPNQGTFIIRSDKPSKLVLTNEIGQHLLGAELSEANNFQHQFESLKPGIYFVLSKNTSGTTVRKIVVTD